MEVYKPSEDTFLLAECIEGLNGENALDLCTGSGYIAYILSKRFKRVIATDINIEALKLAKKAPNIFYVCCHGASAINTKFDLITMNPPYLPSEGIVDIAIDGGKNGIEVTLSIVDTCLDLMHKYSKMFIVSSSLSDVNTLVKKLDAKIVKKKRIGFEDIIVLEVDYPINKL